MTLSPAMKAALEVIRAGGGVAIRRDGAVFKVWGLPGQEIGEGRPWWRDSTIATLIVRGELEVTKRANGVAIEVRVPGEPA